MSRWDRSISKKACGVSRVIASLLLFTLGCMAASSPPSAPIDSEGGDAMHAPPRQRTLDDADARRALGLAADSDEHVRASVALPATTRPEISPSDFAAHVEALTDPRMEGRRAGSDGELVAANYLTRAMQAIGLQPAGVDGGFLHPFEFTAGIALGPGNALSIESASGEVESFEVETDWRPLAFSRSGEVEASDVVFAGYGLVAPSSNETGAIDEYANLDVTDRWVLVFRDLPHALDGARRQHLRLHASLRYKAMIARDRGARGILFVSGPLGSFREQLAPLRFDASLAGTRIAVLSISDAVAGRLVSASGLTLEKLQKTSDLRLVESGGTSHENVDRGAAIAIDGAWLRSRIDLETLRAEGHNVIGRLQVGPQESTQSIVLGAHFDHLGRGEGSSSLATGSEVGEVHEGADDNASGVAVLLEIAEQLAHRRAAGVDLGERDFIFAGWSGEELGLLGSDAWVKEQTNPHSNEEGPVAYLNFDMVGRLEKDLIVQGLGSSSTWSEILEHAAEPLALSIVSQNDAYLPTDTTSFYTQGVPVLSAFTGVHAEYHTPRDQADLLNPEGAAQIGELFTRIAQALSRASAPPDYRAQEAPSAGQGRTGFRVFLGTVPDYAQTADEGVLLSGVAPAGPAEKAGLRGGDIIVQVDGRTIENLYDYTYALEALRVGEPAKIAVLRDGERILLEVVPASRD